MRTVEMLARANASTIALMKYLDRLIVERRSHPKDDLLTALVEAEESGDRLSQEELVIHLSSTALTSSTSLDPLTRIWDSAMARITASEHRWRESKFS